MKTKILLLVSVLLFSFSACKKSNDQENDSRTGQLTGVLSETIMSSQDVANSLSAQVLALTGFDIDLLPLAHEMKVAVITYSTTGVEGDIVDASGVIAYRTDVSEYDHIVSVQHGTCDIASAPSKVGFPAEAAPAFNEEVVVMADYLGYGSTERPDLLHPYMHSTITGTTCADMISAAEQYLEEKTELRKYGDKIKLIGYSQGGAATVSTLLELEARGMKQRIADVWAGAGPHDLRVFFNNFVSDPDYEFGSTGYLPFVVRGLAYGDHLNLDFHNIYAPVIFEKGIDKLFDNTQISDLHEILGTKVSDILHPDFYEGEPDFNGNADIQAFYKSLEKHSLVLGAKPQTEIKLFHCPTDNTVPSECTMEAKEVWSNTVYYELHFTNHIISGAEFYVKYLKWSSDPVIQELFNRLM